VDLKDGFVDQRNETGVIAFDDVEIDLDGHRLTVGGNDVALEPKAFTVLTLLASHPGKTLTHNDILDAVWGHRHVTQNVLHRAITLLRQALGGHSPPRQYIHTVHGVGYRFDAGVRRLPQPAAAAIGESAPAALPKRANENDASIPVIGDASTPSVLVREAAENGRSRQVHPRWKFFLLAITASAVLLAVAAAFVFRTSPSPTPASPTLVVLPMHAIGDDKGESAFAEGLSEELTTRLARIDGLRLISSTSATRAQHDGFDAAQLAERLHVTHALEGSLREDGDQLRIDLRLVETPSGRTVWAQGYDRKLADVFTLQQDIAQAVASALALHIGLARSTTSPPDPRVFREYLELRHIFLTGTDMAKYDQAEKDLGTLAARAPDFAPAHSLLALNLASDFEGPGREADALREARRALALDANDAYAHATLGLLAEKNRDWITTKKEYGIALVLNPSDAVMHNITGMWLSRLGYEDLAVAQEEIAYASDPLGYWVAYNLGVQLDVTGQHDAAKRYLDQLPNLENAPIAFTVDARWRNAIRRRDFPAARDIAAHASNEMGFADALTAVTDALIDPSRWPQADAAITTYETKTGSPNRLRVFAPHPNAEALLAGFETGTQHPNGKLLWATEFGVLRRDPAFRGFLKRMKFIDYWNANDWPPQCKPDGDSARCD